MTRFVALVGVLGLAPALFGQTQERPNYSGTWTLIESATSGSPRFGKEFKLTQSPTTVSIETTVTVSSGSMPPGGGAMVIERKDMFSKPNAIHSAVQCSGASSCVMSDVL